MNSAYLDMKHSLNTATSFAGVKGMEMSVLERQKMVLKRQQEQILKLQQEELNCYNDVSMLSYLPAQSQSFQMLNMGCGRPSTVAAGPTTTEFTNREIKADPNTENGWVDFGVQQSGVTVDHSGVESAGQVNSSCYGMDYAISRTASLPPTAPVAEATVKIHHDNVKGEENSPLEQKLGVETWRECSKKRKAEKSLMTPKVGEAEACNRSKKSKGCPKEEESKTTEHKCNRNNSGQTKQKEINDIKNKKTSGCTSRDNSKTYEVQKPDYIHVRARRGQATDSHSLAERVRREKISERMRYLQDLVPGCSKITGKAGMLDEIINYVQSLQRQVEFLSMKLAVASPAVDFNIDELIAKEVLAACSSSLPTMGVSPDFTSPNYLQYNLVQQMDPVCGSEVVGSSIDMGLQRNIKAPVSTPDPFFDTSCFNHITNSIIWDADLQNAYSMEFQQGRPLQTFTGTIDAGNLKLGM
ncbi:hypothetical protein RND81_11G171700 [Saponaria officinalis]|uniref:BHLH domain-containing protein n=1 Tax=Saponaria officinalis TaxID=3572 RepID=A0AAW1HNA7_SAPOF